MLRLGRRPQPSERRSRREARPPSGAGQPTALPGRPRAAASAWAPGEHPRLPKGPRSGAEPAWLARDTRGRSPRIAGRGRLHGARSKVSGRPGAGMATPGRPACAWPACATSGNVESLESIRPKCVNQPDRPAWSWRMAHVRETGRCHTTGMWNFLERGQCVGARRTPRYPLERGHLAGRGPLEPLGEFRPRPLISRPWKGVASPSLSQNDVIVSNPGSAAARGVPDREENSR